MINYKYDKNIQYGGFGTMNLLFVVIILCVICFCSSACSSWPIDFDEFAGGFLKGAKIRNPFGGIFDNIFGQLKNIFGEIDLKKTFNIP